MSTWINLKLADCSIDFPTTPQEVPNTIATPNNQYKSISYKRYSWTDQSGNTLILQTGQFNQLSPNFDPKLELDTALKGFLDMSPTHQLVSSQFGQSNGYPCLDYTVKDPQVDFFVLNHTVIIKDKFYNLMGIVKTQDSPLWTQFVSSFQAN